MAITPEQIVDSLLAIASEQNEHLYDYDTGIAEAFEEQISEVYAQYESMKQ